jgi:hypothetical protein
MANALDEAYQKTSDKHTHANHYIHLTRGKNYYAHC